jgi:hypothetical protein
MAQVVSRRPVTAKARVCSRASPRRFVVGEVALGQVFLRVLRFSPVDIIHVDFYSCITWGMYNRHVGGHSSEKWSHAIVINNLDQRFV